MARRDFKDLIKQPTLWNSAPVQKQVEDPLDPLPSIIPKVAQDRVFQRVEIWRDIGAHGVLTVGREGVRDRSQDPLVVSDARPVLAGASDVERRNKAALCI